MDQTGPERRPPDLSALFQSTHSNMPILDALALQKRFGLSRAIPSELKMQIGSQWWYLRRQSIEKFLKFLYKIWDIKRFFKTTWIPDETLFQTLAWNLIPSSQIMSQSPTFLIFSDIF